jgi:hypothetical protein
MKQLNDLYKLFAYWRVASYTPLTLLDLKPLEQDVESTVLTELIGHVLKPITLLRNVQVIEYQQLRPRTPREVKTVFDQRRDKKHKSRSPSSRKHHKRKRSSSSRERRHSKLVVCA